MRLILLGLIALLSLLLTLLILMHKGKGGGLSDMFGGSLTHKRRLIRRRRKESEPLDGHHRPDMVRAHRHARPAQQVRHRISDIERQRNLGKPDGDA